MLIQPRSPRQGGFEDAADSNEPALYNVEGPPDYESLDFHENARNRSTAVASTSVRLSSELPFKEKEMPVDEERKVMSQKEIETGTLDDKRPNGIFLWRILDRTRRAHLKSHHNLLPRLVAHAVGLAQELPTLGSSYSQGGPNAAVAEAVAAEEARGRMAAARAQASGYEDGWKEAIRVQTATWEALAEKARLEGWAEGHAAGRELGRREGGGG
ncbi:MAG: hypothetical protein M1816_002598 [Peltula sp. TS41687]|nr:MAG: hypothetical protein M1816_002598 [Peltula sp. TS41687]